jgi:putative ABC transport system ATP-binding protein
MDRKSIISIKGLYREFPVGNHYFRALNDISIEFGPGEFAGLVGPSGSGKTTLLNIMGSLDSPTRGEVNVLGRNISHLNTRESALLRKSKLGFIFQSYNLLPVYTVYENIEFPLLLLKLSESARRMLVMEALEWVG